MGPSWISDWERDLIVSRDEFLERVSVGENLPEVLRKASPTPAG
jgi:hypothetical protein